MRSVLLPLAAVFAFAPTGRADDAAYAKAVIEKNLNYLLKEYPNPTTNLWEERDGLSVFARSVQLRCFQAIKDNTLGIPVPEGIDGAIVSLNRLAGEPVDLLVNGTPIARGEVVVIDEEFGLRITEVGAGMARLGEQADQAA